MTRKKRLVVLSGAGISAESGLKTFRDSDGLWEGYAVQDVATPQAWHRNQELVLRFYNERRQSVLEAEPNQAHKIIANLEVNYDVTVVTQNIDNLHERAGSTKVIHLHGEIFKSQSTRDPLLIYEIDGSDLNLGEKCEKGSQLRPFIVWFGEAVPMMEAAIKEVQQAEIFLVIGTSLVVYPAASLVDFVPSDSKKFLIDPKANEIGYSGDFEIIAEVATQGMERLLSRHLS